MSMFSTKDPAEIVTLTFDFSALTTAVTGPVVTVAALIGVDAAPWAVLSGVAQVNGAKVLQQVQGGLLGVHYEFQCLVTAADSSKYVLSEALPVIRTA